MKVVQIRQYFWKSLQPTELCEDSKIFKIWGPGKKALSGITFLHNIFINFELLLEVTEISSKCFHQRIFCWLQGSSPSGGKA